MKKTTLILWGLFTMISKALSQTYTYDNNHQVTQIKYDNGPTITIQYDANGNKTSYVVTPNSALPLQLLSFNAQKSGEQVLLTWATSQEINSDRFEVEHSVDANSFSSFVAVPARGNSTTRYDYSTIHCCPIEGVNYYRLKMIDRDGGFIYSEVRKVTFVFTNTMKVYPNPASDKSILSISFKKSFNNDANITIYNTNGALIYSSILAKGKTLTQVSIGSFAAGTYYIVTTVNGELYKEKFVKQ
jgi:YD repeat-containing protein